MIIVASVNEKDLVHLGGCKNLVFFDVEGKKICGKETMENPVYNNHVPKVLPNFLISKKANIIITAAAGPMAVEIFEEAGVKVLFAEGDMEKVVNQYINGELGEGKNFCTH